MSCKDYNSMTSVCEYTESTWLIYIAIWSDMIKVLHGMCHSLTKGHLDKAVCQIILMFLRCTSE